MSRPRHVKFAREAARYAESIGFENVRIERCRRHPMITGTFAGRVVSRVLPGTPSDWRSQRNAFADLRRAAREARP